ncbi:MAG: zinc ribbon domain-containing protein [Candidatus Thorarchaeota archaeon]
MQDQILCPECGKRIRRGSTFCIGCGKKIPENTPLAPPEPDLGETTMNEPSESNDELPSLEESGLEAIEEEAAHTTTDSLSADDELTWEEPPASPAPEPATEDLSWDDNTLPVTEDTPAEDLSLIEASEPEIEAKAEDSGGRSTDLVWEDDEIKVGMPFKEVAPPRIYDEEVSITTEEALEHLFPDGVPTEVREETKEAVEHLFPEGRGSTTTTFIDVVVGKPSKIGPSSMKELQIPACPNCGIDLTSDDFEYPDYVFDAMGRARLEHGEHHLKENEHEKAIESFEMAKMLFEKAGNEKGVQESVKRVDLGYDAMARFHFDQGENHLKVQEYEWAIVQFRKARELYMFSTDAKKRARCTEKVRESYIEWGKTLESDGDGLSKDGHSRDALSKYQEAADKYRHGEDKKRLRGLEKKIRKA